MLARRRLDRCHPSDELTNRVPTRIGVEYDAGLSQCHEDSATRCGGLTDAPRALAEVVVMADNSLDLAHGDGAIGRGAAFLVCSAATSLGTPLSWPT